MRPASAARGETLFRVNGWFMSKDRIPPHIKKEPLDIGKFIAEMRQKKCDVVAIWTAHIDVASPQFKSAANALAEAGFKTNAWTIKRCPNGKKTAPEHNDNYDRQSYRNAKGVSQEIIVRKKNGCRN